ncbi:MAG: hypothetical protein JWQ90_4030 [Hydrocarboniphaga sp.]|uniref:hypothetical protein n=1 Tax=Hydrocarboniphaga sp. TaxID=2033016 RepID=UPI0026158EC2|nr:hypothetical protein [Hydrocarboniphaga sp.]MDB5971580.1 hypothetical protein [Hydrocarboniphaga sp.]
MSEPTWAETKGKMALVVASRIQRESMAIERAPSAAKMELACRRTLLLMQSVRDLPELRGLIADFDQHLARIQAIERVASAVECVERSYTFRRRGDAAAERNELLGALALIRNRELTNRDFEIAAVMPKDTGEIVKVENVVERLRQLGWTYQMDDLPPQC